MLAKLLFFFLCSTRRLEILAWMNGPRPNSSRRTELATSRSKLFLASQQLGAFEVLTPEELHRPSNGSNIQDHQLEPGAIVTRMVVLEDLVANDHRVDFQTAWDWQKSLVEEHVQRLTKRQDESPFIQEKHREHIENGDLEGFCPGGVDTVFMLEHHPIYTLGTGSDEKFILGTNEKVPTIRMDRGGEVTYHGPGQLVMYPNLDLRWYRQDIHWYMRALEETIIRALKSCGVDATRDEDTTGVWVNNKKVAAIGVKCRKWITMHGLAVNVEPSSLENFEGIVPCGLEGREVGCVNQFLKDRPPLTVQDFSEHLKVAFEEVFQVEFQTKQRMDMPRLKR